MAADAGSAGSYPRALIILLRYAAVTAPVPTFGLATLVLLAAAANIAAMIAAVGLIGALGDTDALLRAAVLLAVAVVAGETMTVLADAVAADTGARVEARLRHRLLSVTRPGDQAQPDGIGDVVDGGYSPETVLSCLASIAVRLLTAVAAIALLALFTWWAPLLILVTHLFGRRQTRQLFLTAVTSTIDERRTLARAGYLVDLALTPETAKEWRLFGLHRHVLAELRREWRLLIAVVAPRRARMMRAALSANALVAGSVAVVLIPLALSAGRGDLSVERFVLVVQALLAARGLTSFSGADYAVVNALPALRAAIGAAGSTPSPARTALAHPADPVGRAVPATGVPASGLSGASGPVGAAGLSGASGPVSAAGPSGAVRVEIDDVSFRYVGADRPALDRVRLVLPAGRLTAIVGANGAGKTTLVNLLQGSARPDSGRILIDGTDLAALPAATWSADIALVRQDFVRYPLSVADNVAVGAEVDPAAVEQVLQAAGVADAVAALPAGIDTVLMAGQAAGAQLSGGQWQRIALARALYAARRGARLVLLDEPTASLDPRSELETFRTVLDVLADRTVVLVSHRFAAVRLADHIVVLDEGRVVEAGGHDELLALDGWYAQAYRTQADRYQQMEAR